MTVLNIPIDCLLAIISTSDRGLRQWVILRMVCKKWLAYSKDIRWIALLQPVCVSCNMVKSLVNLPGLRYARLQDAEDDWLRALLPLKSHLQEVNLNFSFRVTEQAIIAITALTQLHSLHVVSVGAVTVNALLALSALPMLRKLECDMFFGVPKALLCFDHLEELILRNCTFSLKDFFAAMKPLKRLQLEFQSCDDECLIGLPSSLMELETSSGGVTDKGMERIALAHNLRWLAVESPLVTNDGIKQLTSLKQLEYLYLACPLATGEGVPPLSSSIHEIRCSPIDSGMRFMQSMTTLRRLFLDQPGCSVITDHGFAFLSNFTTLMFLSVLCPLITNECKTFQHLPNLCEVIGDCGAGLGVLSPLVQLRSLSWRCKISTDADLISLSYNLVNLQELSLIDNDLLTDTGLRSIADLTRLESLTINVCPLVTDEGMMHISGLKKLRWLSMTELPLITDKTVNMTWSLDLQMLEMYECTGISDDALDNRISALVENNPWLF